MSADLRAPARAASMGIVLAGLALILAFSPRATAADIHLTATFQPSILEPSRNTFVNTSPNAPLCENRPDVCRNHPGMELPFQVDYGRFDPEASGIHHAHFRFPDGDHMGGPIKVTVKHTETGESTTLGWRATMIAGTYVLPRPVKDIVGVDSADNEQLHGMLWGTSWQTSPDECGSVSYGSARATSYTWAWQLPGNREYCTKMARYEFESMRMENMVMAYQLTAPDPLAMKNGTYEGELWLNIGNAGNLDFGANAQASDSWLILHFTLTVSHFFDVRFPAGADTLLLHPEGGWQRWVDYHERPQSLVNELPFEVTTSSGFSVQARCGIESGPHCGLRRDGETTVVPLQMDLTVPGMVEEATGRAVQRTRVPTEHSALPMRLATNATMVNRPSRLRFLVEGAAVDTLLDAPGSEWSGDVTVVFDSEP